MTDDAGGRGARDPGHVVMFGPPIAQIAPALGMAGEVKGIAECLGGVTALNDRCRIQDREGNHGNPTSFWRSALRADFERFSDFSISCGNAGTFRARLGSSFNIW